MTKMITTALGSAAIALLALTGCNTTEGIGEDLSKAGHAISNAATETSQKLSSDDSKSATTSSSTKKVSSDNTGTTATTTTTTSSKTVDSKK